MSEIKVGSEWVDPDYGTKFKVDYIGKSRAMITMEGKEECSVPLRQFNRIYKPAPVRRTVWLNVYSVGAVSHNSKIEADKGHAEDLLFQQEVELIDPREGEKVND